MKILEYPTLLNKELRCDICGCRFSLNKQDIKKRMHANLDEASREYVASISCPCCRGQVIDKGSVIDNVLHYKYEEINNVFKNKAEEIGKMSIVNRQELCRIVDDIYNDIMAIEER